MLSKYSCRLCEALTLLGCALQVKPALLHGDLWSGNMTTVSDGGWAILDPAVYYGASCSAVCQLWAKALAMLSVAPQTALLSC